MATAMPFEEGDWIDGEIAASPHTTSGHPIVWQVYIGYIHDSMQWADCKPHE